MGVGSLLECFGTRTMLSGGLQDGSVDIAREVMDLRTIQQRRLYKRRCHAGVRV